MEKKEGTFLDWYLDTSMISTSFVVISHSSYNETGIRKV